MSKASLALGLTLSMSALSADARAQWTERVDRTPTGGQPNGSAGWSHVSADGRFVAFSSSSNELVAFDANGTYDAFVLDRLLGTIELVSVSSQGVQSAGQSGVNSMSADARYVLIGGNGSDLDPADANANLWDLFVRDRQNGTTTLVSVGSNGQQGIDDVLGGEISADGRFVAFSTPAANIVPDDTNGVEDVFVRDLQAGTTVRASVSSSGAQANGPCQRPHLSADGRFVVFDGSASNLAAGDTNTILDVFVRDLQTGTTTRVSVPIIAGVSAGSVRGTISGDGRWVAFESFSSKLVAGDTNGTFDIFVRDLQLGVNERVSVSSTGTESDAQSHWARISLDGQAAVFQSFATNLVPQPSLSQQTYIHHRQLGTTERISVGPDGAPANALSEYALVSPDGRYVTFDSYATNLVSGSSGTQYHAFLRDLRASGFESLCEPGAGSVQACPCANPPSTPGAGCDNSAGTGGAFLAASGVAYLANDTLSFTASGETPSATSILLQGNAEIASGVPFGQGVRCAGGGLKRLYVGNASGGTFTAPTIGAPAVSSMSAALGDAILPGESRAYLVYYRDPVVLGGCPATSTFNATQTGRVTWWP